MSEQLPEYNVTVTAGPTLGADARAEREELLESAALGDHIVVGRPTQRFAVFFDPHITVSDLHHALATIGVHLMSDKDGRMIADRMHIFEMVKADPA